jgi:hypothetical protein
MTRLPAYRSQPQHPEEASLAVGRKTPSRQAWNREGNLVVASLRTHSFRILSLETCGGVAEANRNVVVDQPAAVTVGRLCGGFHGFGRQQKAQTQQDASNAGNQASGAAANKVNTELTSQRGAAASGPSGQTAAVFMETSTTMSGFFIASVDDSRFAVPAGYQEDQPKLMYK